MRYEVLYNKVRNVWVVWCIENNGNAQVVKTFKTEASARKWAGRQ